LEYSLTYFSPFFVEELAANIPNVLAAEIRLTLVAGAVLPKISKVISVATLLPTKMIRVIFIDVVYN